MEEAPAAPEDWTAVLDGLEASISLAFAGEDAGWQPPAADPGPIPPELIDRAMRVLDARQEAEQILAGNQVTVSRHLGAVNAVPVTENRRTRLLDVSA